MNVIDENRNRAIQVLKSDDYEIDEFDGTILASKYCDRGNGGVMCLLFEVISPYNRIQVWGNNNELTSNDSLSKLISTLNEDLYKLKRSTHDSK